MFSPPAEDLERGWPGKIQGDRVIQVAAQTLQAFFTGGGKAREHAEYPLAEVVLRAPVLHPPAVRIFDGPEEFVFANPAAVLSPGQPVEAFDELEVHARLTAIVGRDDIGGFTLMAEVRAPALPPSIRNIALPLGPVVVTEPPSHRFDWSLAWMVATANAPLYPGDLLAAPAHEVIRPGDQIEISYEGIGTLSNPVED